MGIYDYRTQIIPFEPKDQNKILKICEEEIFKIILPKVSSAFRKKINVRLLHLRDYKENCINNAEYFEPIDGEKYYYNMVFRHFKPNIRIIFRFVKGGNSTYPLFLHAFVEGKKSDYKIAIPKAISRYRIYLERGNDYENHE